MDADSRTLRRAWRRAHARQTRARARPSRLERVSSILARVLARIDAARGGRDE